MRSRCAGVSGRQAGPGSRRGRAGRSRFFRYEIRRWRDRTIPDIAEAVASPLRLSADSAQAQRLLDLLGDADERGRPPLDAVRMRVPGTAGCRVGRASAGSCGGPAFRDLGDERPYGRESEVWAVAEDGGACAGAAHETGGFLRQSAG
jgi:hypothetical protein